MGIFKARKQKIGLALGGGGARGLAHIGVLKVLEKNNIPIDFIAGSSMGAIVGSFYASSKSIEDIEKIADTTDWKKMASLLDPTLGQGLLEGNKVLDFIKDEVGDISFSSLRVPFAAIATDLKTGEAVTLKEGKVAHAVRASISLPLIFKPLELDGKILADGGLSMPVPVDAVRKMGADIVIAVNLDTNNFPNNYKDDDKLGFYKIANNSLNILRYNLAFYNSKDADLLILPKLDGFSMGDFHKVKEIIKSGEDAVSESMKDLKKILK
jgi:NTE family protein